MVHKSSEKHTEQGDQHFAVIDIGSNSVRLVVFDGLFRHPQVLFNEKVLCGLGRMVGKSGLMDDEAMDHAIRTLGRFRLLLKTMRVTRYEAIATAAVRDADNGVEFAERVHRETGIRVRIISGKEEASLSAMGVISGMPEADGIVGDLGGGSLELVEVKAGAVSRRVTLPIGPVRLRGQYNNAALPILRDVKAALKSVPWLDGRRPEEFYIVGGAWRAISRVNMVQKNAVLPILHGFMLPGGEARSLAKLIARQDPESLARIRGVSPRRAGDMPTAALILQHILGRMKPKRVVSSSFGLREGVVYTHLDDTCRMADPFIEAARELAIISGRFPEHGDRLMKWIDPIFDGDPETTVRRRLRYGTCLLADIAWRGHPDFRSERAVMEALYGRFVGIDHNGRAFIGLALNRLYGGASNGPLASLCRSLLDEADIADAIALGAALRLGQRLSGGTAKLLKRTRLERRSKHLVLLVDKGHDTLINDVVRRRFESLASCVGLTPLVQFAESLDDLIET